MNEKVTGFETRLTALETKANAAAPAQQQAATQQAAATQQTQQSADLGTTIAAALKEGLKDVIAALKPTATADDGKGKRTTISAMDIETIKRWAPKAANRIRWMLSWRPAMR